MSVSKQEKLRLELENAIKEDDAHKLRYFLWNNSAAARIFKSDVFTYHYKGKTYKVNGLQLAYLQGKKRIVEESTNRDRSRSKLEPFYPNDLYHPKVVELAFRQALETDDVETLKDLLKDGSIYSKQYYISDPNDPAGDQLFCNILAAALINKSEKMVKALSSADNVKQRNGLFFEVMEGVLSDEYSIDILEPILSSKDNNIKKELVIDLFKHRASVEKLLKKEEMGLMLLKSKVDQIMSDKEQFNDNLKTLTFDLSISVRTELNRVRDKKLSSMLEDLAKRRDEYNKFLGKVKTHDFQPNNQKWVENLLVFFKGAKVTLDEKLEKNILRISLYTIKSIINNPNLTDDQKFNGVLEVTKSISRKVDEWEYNYIDLKFENEIMFSAYAALGNYLLSKVLRKMEEPKQKETLAQALSDPNSQESSQFHQLIALFALSNSVENKLIKMSGMKIGNLEDEELRKRTKNTPIFILLSLLSKNDVVHQLLNKAKVTDEELINVLNSLNEEDQGRFRSHYLQMLKELIKTASLREKSEAEIDSKMIAYRELLFPKNIIAHVDFLHLSPNDKKLQEEIKQKASQKLEKEASKGLKSKLADLEGAFATLDEEKKKKAEELSGHGQGQVQAQALQLSADIKPPSVLETDSIRSNVKIDNRLLKNIKSKCKEKKLDCAITVVDGFPSFTGPDKMVAARLYVDNKKGAEPMEPSPEFSIYASNKNKAIEEIRKAFDKELKIYSATFSAEKDGRPSTEVIKKETLNDEEFRKANDLKPTVKRYPRKLF